MLPRPKHILLTGPPGCGKTTVIQGVIDLLPAVQVAGFYTREIREHDRRTGFEMVGLCTDVRAVLASVHSTSELRLRRYGIELSGLEEIVERELRGELPQLFVIDEIGKIELYSQQFIEAVRNILDSHVSVLGTVAIRGEGLIQDVKLRPDTKIVEVNDTNRNDLPAQIADRLQNEMS